jgi:hypothetical protein
LHKWDWRRLHFPGIGRFIFFFVDDTRALLNQQLEWLSAEQKGCDERDIRIRQVHLQKAAKREPVKFSVKENFAVVQVGKDGTEKYRSSEPVPAKVLFARIDQMPMRQSELKRKEK